MLPRVTVGQQQPKLRVSRKYYQLVRFYIRNILNMLFGWYSLLSWFLLWKWIFSSASSHRANWVMAQVSGRSTELFTLALVGFLASVIIALLHRYHTVISFELVSISIFIGQFRIRRSLSPTTTGLYFTEFRQPPSILEGRGFQRVLNLLRCRLFNLLLYDLSL